MENTSFSWLFLSRRILEKTQDYLSSLEKEGVLDPLGLGILRDSYSDDLFPGVTVQHSKIKYLFFILNRLYEYYVGEGKAIGKNGHYDNRDDMEKDLRSTLIETIGKKIGFSGIIGYTITNGLPVNRPSAIYWSCIKKLRLLKEIDAQIGLSLSWLDEIHNQIQELTYVSVESDAKDGSGYENGQLLTLRNSLNAIFEIVHPVIEADRNFWKSWDLTSAQAELLKNKYRELNDAAGSILMYQLIEDNNDYSNVSHISMLGQHFKDNKILKDALNFSFIAGGMYLFFGYFLLEECRSRRILLDKIRELDRKNYLITEQLIDAWMSKLTSIMPPSDLAERCKLYKSKSPFLEISNFFQMSLEFKDSWLSHKSEFKELVFGRERAYKLDLKAKSVHPDELIIPASDLVCQEEYYYNYRWHTARDHLYYIRKGLGKKVG